MTHLARALSPLRDAEPGVRWVRREQWHLTLVFLAAVPADAVDALVAGLRRAAAGTPPLRLALAGAGAFPRTERARVVWAGLGGDVAALGTLAEGCRDAAVAAGVAVEARPFHAHLTVARARRRPVRAGALVDALADYAGPPWTADELELVHSRPGAGAGGGSHYATVATAPLTRRARPGP